MTFTTVNAPVVQKYSTVMTHVQVSIFNYYLLSSKSKTSFMDAKQWQIYVACPLAI